MKAPLIIGLLLAATCSFAESVVLRDLAHSASLIYERHSDKGSTVETLTWSIGRTSRIVKSTYSDSGTLTERSVSVTNSAGVSTRSDAKISAREATVTLTNRAGTGAANTIALAKRTDIADPSLRWFVSTQPEKGASVAFMSFDPEHRYWEEVTATFEGRGKIGVSPEGNLVTRKSARKTVHLLLDAKGMPLVWQENQLHLVRTSS